MSVTARHIPAMLASVGTIFGMAVASSQKDLFSQPATLFLQFSVLCANFVLAVCFE